MTTPPSVRLEDHPCPRCKGTSYLLSTEEGARGNAETQGLFCTSCNEWTTTRDRPPGVHLTQPRPAIMGSALPTPESFVAQGPTDLRVWCWLLAEILQESNRVHTAAAQQSGQRTPTVHDTAVSWLQRFYATEHGTAPQSLYPSLLYAAKGGK